MKRFLSLLLVLVMALSVLCVYAETEREVVTITMLSLPANVSGTMEDTWWTDYLLDELGIIVELVPGSSDDGKLTALMAADELPDMVIFHSATQLVNCINAEMLVALDDYIEQMPNAEKYFSKCMAYFADNYSTDGKCYAISNDVGARTKNGLINWAPNIRWDLYEELGMPEINTVWDYLDVLKDMQELYPVNDEGQKVYALTAWNDWDNIRMHNACQVSMLMGVDTGDQYSSMLPFAEVDLETNELIGSYFDEGSYYVEGLRWYYTANQMGILDPDSMTQTWNSALEKSTAGRVLFGWWSWQVSGFNTVERVNADDPVGFAAVTPTESKVPVQCESFVGSGWSWAISKKASNIDRCIEYLDFMCNPDKVFVLCNGPQGETWDIDENGQVYLTEKGLQCKLDGTLVLDQGGKLGDGTSVINSTPVSTGTISEKYGAALSSDDWDSYIPEMTNLEKEVYDLTGYKTTADRILDNPNHTVVQIGSLFIPTLPDEMQMLANQIGDVVKTQSWLAIYAADDAEFEACIQAMRDAAYDMGFEQLMEYNISAWNTALETYSKY